MTKHMFAALAFVFGIAVMGNAQALLPELEPPKPAPAPAPAPKPVPPKPPELTPPKPKSHLKSPQKSKPGPSQKHSPDNQRRQPTIKTSTRPRSHPSAHWCEDIGGKRNGKICEVPYTQEECDQERGELDEKGLCHFPVPNCADRDAYENEKGICIAREGKKRQVEPEPEPEPDCDGDQEPNEDGDCVTIKTSEQICREDQGTWDSLRNSCLPKE